MGRTVSWTTLVCQVAMLASSSALLRAKNPLALASRVSPPAREAAWATIAQCPGGSSEPGPSAQ